RLNLRKKKVPAEQLDLFSPISNPSIPHPAIDRLKRLDVDSLSAGDALEELKRLKKLTR
ncbi:MAG: hypothetical protein HQK89_18085, partial [Nitrospirae bacterium]|nr:hypothetical protein [Nitrospirota bacterium]